jgi:hypothetical protein
MRPDYADPFPQERMSEEGNGAQAEADHGPYRQ